MKKRVHVSRSNSQVLEAKLLEMNEPKIPNLDKTKIFQVYFLQGRNRNEISRIFGDNFIIYVFYGEEDAKKC
jgi:hypothetical protein